MDHANRQQKTIRNFTTIFIFTLSLFLGFVMITACEGPAGQQGPQGPQGPEGPQGPKGDEGTANVIYSDWITPDSWTPAEFFGDSLRYFDIVESDLTQEIIDQGFVKVYVDFFNADFIYQLPVTDIPGFADFTLNYKVRPDTLKIEFFDKANPNSDPGSFDTRNVFRYVIIPGGQAASSKAKINREVFKNMSYEELQKRFDIPENGSGKIPLN